MRKKLFIISVILGFTVFFSALCPRLCPSDLLGLEFMPDGRCPLSSHALAFSGQGLATLFFLPLIGVFLFRKIPFPREDFALPLFRPPRVLV